VVEAAAERVVIAGGGIAALEGLLAIKELTDGQAEVTLVAPGDEFTYRPLLVREPFSPEPADRRSLPAIAESLGASFVQSAVDSVDADARRIGLAEGGELPFAQALIAVGARMLPALPSAHTLWSESAPETIEQILAGVPDNGRLNLIVPPGVTWPLPLYEFALMTARRLRELGERGIELMVITPEQAPLIVFGTQAAAEVAELLELRGIGFCPDTWVTETDDGILHATGRDPDLSGPAVALPVMEGRRIGGLPADEHGFIPIDEHCRVRGLDGVFAAGDGTSFPIKQGGIATQQADACAEQIALELGAAVDPQPFRPVLRGKLLTGGESVHMRSEVSGGSGEGTVSSDYLWWPPHKVSGRYLAPWLAEESLAYQSEPPTRSIDVEVSLPHEWHAEPMSSGAHEPPKGG
jgi:sulfide:quinone oxidoreductase